jgi:hypothetical protein
MAIPQGWAHKTKTYLTQLLTDWQTSRGLTGSVNEGGGDISGTFAAPRIYILELNGYPHFDDDNLLNVGYRIRFKFTEVQLDEALEQMTSTVEDLKNYIGGAVHYRYPIMAAVPPPWIGCDIDDPDFPEIYDVKRGYLCNEVNLDVVFRLTITSVDWRFPQRFAGG